MEKLLEVAKEFIEVNEGMSITGTLMLKLRGIDIGREPDDLDLLISDYAPNVVFPKGMDIEVVNMASDGCSLKYKVDNIKVDILSSGEKPEVINGIPLGSVQYLMNAKFEYCQQDNSAAQKHKDDLIKLGFDFEKALKEKELALPI